MGTITGEERQHFRQLTAWNTPNSSHGGPAACNALPDHGILAQVQPGTNASGSTTNVYTYLAAGSAKPHTITSITDGSGTDSFTYDNAGNTTGRTVVGASQTLT